MTTVKCSENELFPIADYLLYRSKRSEGGKTVTARTNKASELREVAIKKKLESTPAQSTTVSKF